MKRFILSTFIHFFTLIPVFLNAQVNKQDSLALVDLYNSTDGPNWGVDYQTTWLTSTRVDYWRGIEIENGRVIKVELRYDVFWQRPKLNGYIPESIGNLSELKFLDLSGISGALPSAIGNLTKLEFLRISSHSTGTIPEAIGKLKELRSLILDGDLTGSIPESIGYLTLLTKLQLGRDLSGSIPSSIGNLMELTHLNLSRNNLEGEIPSTLKNLKKLIRIDLYGNELTGTIPGEIMDFASLEYLFLYGNNLVGPIPDFGKLQSLKELRMNDNKLSGEIPVSIGQLDSVKYINLSTNNLSGQVPNSISKLKHLANLGLSNNNLSGNLPIELCNSSSLSGFYVAENNFNYANLEPFAECTKADFSYYNQAELELDAELIGDSIKLSFNKAGGNFTSEYNWRKRNNNGGYPIISTTTQNFFKIPKTEEIKLWKCTAKNSLLPGLELVGIAPDKIEETDCWQAGQLTFCLNSGKWEKGSGTNKIKTTNTLSINDFLFFDGTMTIDTLALEVSANGEFYVDNIPLPGGGLGKYTLLEGEQNLSLIGSEGKIMDFLNTGLSKTASLFGARLSIDDLQFFSRQDTFGIKVGCSAHIPWISESCGNPGIYTPGTDLKLKNLEITNKGIMSAGFEAENIGLFKAGYCLNRITYEHDWKNDIIIAGGDISLPFFADVSGGYKLENGKIDSVAWSIEGGDMLPTTPIGVGTLGVSGFYGHISGLNQSGDFEPANMDIMFGGIFSDVTSDKFYRITADGRTIWPKLFEFSGTGKILQPMEELPYQVQGDIKASLNVPNKLLNIDYTGNFLTMDEQYWLAVGSGGYTIDHSKTEPEVEGYFSGDITLPEISSYWPFNWFNSKTFGTYMKVFNENLKMVHGLLYYYPIPTETSDAMLVKMAFIVNTEKEFYESGYLRFPEDSRVDIAVNFEIKSGLIDNNVTETIVVPENSEFGVIEIKSQTEAPVSSITSPSGKKFSDTSIEDRIIYSETEDKKTAFWSLLNAEPGDWQITLENPQNNDSIISHFQLKAKDFNFTMNQTGNIINLTWDVSQVDSGQVVNFMFDDDNEGFDGFNVVSADANLGSVSFLLDDYHTDCNYYLYAQLYDDLRVTEVYSDDIIENHLSTLAPPQNFSFVNNTQTGEIDFSWDPSPSSEITGYILSISDNSGNDSVYAVLDNGTENISLFVENYEDKFAKIESYNHDWKIGCAATLPSLVTAVNDENFMEEPLNKLNVFPNPTTGNLTIRYYVSEDSKCEIMVFDICGRRIAHPFSGFQPAGFHQVNFEYNEIPNGIYLIKFVNNQESYTVKSILNK